MTARSKGGTCWLANAECEFESIHIAGSIQPICLPDRNRPAQSYVLSPRAAWISYAKEEALHHVASHLASLAKIAATCAFSPVSFLLRACGLDNAALVANRLISTNLYPEWGLAEIHALGDELITRYPEKPLLIRNICPDVTPHLAENLRRSGWKMIPARMVYLCDPQQNAVWKHNHVRQDARLLLSGAFEILGPDQLNASDLPELRALYRQLFIQKHSRLNPDFTTAFFELCLESGFLDLYGLRLQGKMVGVLGLYAESGWLTTPLIGYDTRLPQETGIYRCLMALLLQQAKERQLRLHYSSGASQFKRMRGGVASLEYTAVFSQHLSPDKRLANHLFARGMQMLAPTILRKADAL